MNTTSRIHVQTLVEMNHCVGIARRDAAYDCLLAYVNGPLAKIDSDGDRLAAYRHCLNLVQETLNATERATKMNSQTIRGLWNRPVIHFLQMLGNLIQTMTSLVEHGQAIEQEASILVEHLDKSNFQLLKDACAQFVDNELRARQVFSNTLQLGQEIVHNCSQKSIHAFNDEEQRRYHLAYEEYLRFYGNSQPKNESI